MENYINSTLKRRQDLKKEINTQYGVAARELGMGYAQLQLAQPIDTDKVNERLIAMDDIKDMGPVWQKVSLLSNCLSPDMLSEVVLATAASVDIIPYISAGFNVHQVRIIREGLSSGVDVSVYAYTGISAHTMSIILSDLLDKKNVYSIIDQGVSIIDTPHSVLSYLLSCLYQGYDLIPYYTAGFKLSQIKEVCYAKQEGLDIDEHIDNSMRPDEIQLTTQCIKNGIDTDRVIGAHNDIRASRVLYEALVAGYDLSEYVAVSMYTYAQLNEILTGLKSGLDVNLYKSLEFNDKQMKQIRKGLELKVDVKRYANKDIHHKQMKMMRKMLMDGKSPQVILTIVEKHYKVNKIESEYPADSDCGH